MDPVKTGNQTDDLYLAIQQQRTPEEAASYLADECRKKDKTIMFLNLEIHKTRKEVLHGLDLIEKLRRRLEPCRKPY